MANSVMMIVRLKDKVNPDDPRLDAMCSKRGDVIDILPADYVPSADMQAHYDAGEYVPIIVVGATRDDLLDFLELDMGDEALNIIPQRRSANFDVDSWLAQNQPHPIALATVVSMKLVKARKHAP